METIIEDVKETEKSEDGLKEAFQALATELKEMKQQAVAVKPESVVESQQPVIDWNSMTPAEFQEKIRDLARQDILGALNPVIQQVVALTYNKDKEKVIGVRPELQQYEQQIQKVLVEHPTMSVEDALIFTKAKEPRQDKKSNSVRSIFNVDAIVPGGKADMTAVEAGLRALKDMGLDEI
jgi:hypothetical protein